MTESHQVHACHVDIKSNKNTSINLVIAKVCGDCKIIQIHDECDDIMSHVELMTKTGNCFLPGLQPLNKGCQTVKNI